MRWRPVVFTIFDDNHRFFGRPLVLVFALRKRANRCDDQHRQKDQETAQAVRTEQPEGEAAILGIRARRLVREVERRRDKTASPLLYASIALANYVKQMLTATDLLVELPDGTKEQTRLAFVSNTDPWTYLGAKPIHMNPDCSFDGGLGLFALRSLAPPTIARTLSQILLPLGPPSGGNLLRLDDVAEVRVTAARPVRLQVDGDDLGEHRQVKFTSVPQALRVAV